MVIVDLHLDFKHLLDLGDDEYRFVFQKTNFQFDGESLDCSFFLKSEENDPYHGPYEEFRILGAKHANLIVCGILALLEAYGFPTILDDKDIQDDYRQMVQETKDLYAEKTFKQILDGFKG